MSNRLLWNDPQWRELLRKGMHSLPELPHALLLSGRPGLGKRQFGEDLAALLLCESPRNVGGADGVLVPQACGSCQACHWLGGGNHPDFRRVAPEGDDETESTEVVRKDKKRGSGQIKIDAIRALEDFVFVGSHRHGRRVVLLTEADAMNAAAANAILKILEEPPATVYYILVSSHIKRLLPTIRSRCRVLNFKCPPTPVVTAWWPQSGLPQAALRFLPLAGGAPLTVLDWQDNAQLEAVEALVQTLSKRTDDPLSLAGQWDSLLKRHSQFTLEMLVDGVQRWLFDLGMESAAAATHFHAGWKRETGSSVPSAQIVSAWRDILQFKRSARHPLNQLLFLEDLAARCLRAVRMAGHRNSLT